MTLQKQIEDLIDRGYSNEAILEHLLSEEDGTVCSGDFGNALPADSRHRWKDDGEELNKQARDSLKSMGIEIKENLRLKIGNKIYKLA